MEERHPDMEGSGQCTRRVRKVEIYITCRPIGKFLSLLWQHCRRPWSFTCEPCSFDSGRTGFILSETCLKWQRRSKVPPNARCVPSYDFSTQKVNVQRRFTNKLLLFMVTLWFPLVSSSKVTSRWEKVRRRWWGARRSHDVVQRAGVRILWCGDIEAGSKT